MFGALFHWTESLCPIREEQQKKKECQRIAYLVALFP